MKLTRVYTAALLGVAILAPAASRAEVLAEDPFDYTVGEDIDGQNGGTGWSAGWSVTEIPTDNTGSAVSHTVATGFDGSGGALNVTISEAGTSNPERVKVRRELTTPISAGVVWGSVLLRTNGPVAAGDIYIEMPDWNIAPGKKWGAEFSMANDGSGGKNMVSGKIHLLLWKYDIDGGVASMWVDPADQSSEAALGVADISKVYTIPTLSNVTIGFQRYGDPNVDVDDFVLGTELADVKVDVIPDAPPPAPDPVSPTDAAAAVSLDASLRWTATAATSWEVYLWKDGETKPVDPTAMTTTPSFDPGGLEVVTLYNWQVDATNDNGTTPGAAWTFTTNDGVEAIAPVDGVEGVSLDNPLVWTDNGAASWDVFLWKDGETKPGTPTANVTNPTYATGGLEALTLYHWEIVSNYDAGSPTSSPSYSFTTSDGVPGVLLLHEEFEGYPRGDIIGRPGMGMGLTGGTWAHGGSPDGTSEVGDGLSGFNGLVLTPDTDDNVDSQIAHSVAEWGSGQLWMSYLYNETAYAGHFYVGAGGSYNGASGHAWTGGALLGLHNTTNPGFPYTFGETYRLVTLIDFDAETTTLWVDPPNDPIGYGIAPDAHLVQTPGTTPTLIMNTWCIGTIDDIRIGTGFDAVTKFIAPASSIMLTVTSDATNLNFEWTTQNGLLYDLVEAPDLSGSPLGWTPVDNAYVGMPATMTTASIPHPAEDSTYYAVRGYPAPPEVLLEENFDADDGGFTPVDDSGGTGTPWERGAPDSDNEIGSTVTSDFGGAGQCWATGLGDFTATSDNGYYTGTTNAGLQSPVLDLTTAVGATVEFAHAVDVESADTMVVNFLNSDDGNSVAAFVTYSDLDGNSADWELETLPIPSAALGKNIIIEWRLSTSGTEDYLGWYIDDVKVTKN